MHGTHGGGGGGPGGGSSGGSNGGSNGGGSGKKEGGGGHTHYELAGPSSVWRGTDANFVVKHYAGKIMYTTDGFVRKNRDTLLDTIEACMFKSETKLLANLFASTAGAKAHKASSSGRSSRSSSGGGGGRASGRAGGRSRGRSQRGTAISVTVGKKFKDQLSALIRTMQATTPRFVRCIKSNTQKRPMIFEAPNCLRQLKYAGVMEALRVRRAGFPNRVR
jgi:myosin heavy subunit